MRDTTIEQTPEIAHQHDRDAANLSRYAQDDFQPISRRAQARTSESAILDLSLGDLYGSDDVAKQSARIFERAANQAVEPIPPVSEAIRRAPNHSPIVLNIQVTNVPDISMPVEPRQLLDYAATALDTGAKAVRQTEHYMATPNALNDSFIGVSPALANAVDYYANTPMSRIAADVSEITGQACDAANRALSSALTPQERAKATGSLMPMFFFEGNLKQPIQAEAAEQLGLKGMSESDLAGLGISKQVPDAVDMQMPEVPEHLRHLDFQQATPELLQKMEAKGREIVIAQPGTDDLRYLVNERLEACAGKADLMHILLRPDAKKVAVLEEFLHGTQAKFGLTSTVPREILEYRVKDFMTRHSKLLGLDANDVAVLETLKEREAEKALRRGYSSRLFKVGERE